MRKKFSTSWKSSKQPRKQRKYLANAPLHLKRKMLAVNLSKDLRIKYGIRNIVVKKGDVVKIMRGRFKKKQGKVIEVRTKRLQIIVEGLQIPKRDGSKAVAPMRASNLQIITLDTEDSKRRIKKQEKSKEIKQSKEKKQENAPKKKESS